MVVVQDGLQEAALSEDEEARLRSLKLGDSLSVKRQVK